MQVAVFVTAALINLALLFLVEPMVAKMILPLLGGSQAVWITSVAFFQVSLLLGYAYAHGSARMLGKRTQMVLHLCLLAMAILLLPVHIPGGWVPPVYGSPVPWLLLVLMVSVGLPFLVLSATTPILQRWFALSHHSSAHDPYFLYSASNAGSILGLLSYPFAFEPVLGLRAQSQLWGYGYGLVLLIAVAFAGLAWGIPTLCGPLGDTFQQVQMEREAASGPFRNPETRQVLRWITLAFVPSSLMLGVTTSLTMDVPAIPLFWILPLTVYLASFVFVFARRPVLSHAWLNRRVPFLILAASIPIVSKALLSESVLLPLDLTTLFVVAMVCHGELAHGRPSARHLTGFYLWISLGGVLGGIFNALIAPVVFGSVAEFPLVLLLTALLRVPSEVPNDDSRARRLDFVLPAVLGACVAAAILVLQAQGMRPSRTMNILIFGSSMIWCLSFAKRPLRFALGGRRIFVGQQRLHGPLWPHLAYGA